MRNPSIHLRTKIESLLSQTKNWGFVEGSSKPELGINVAPFSRTLSQYILPWTLLKTLPQGPPVTKEKDAITAFKPLHYLSFGEAVDRYHLYVTKRLLVFTQNELPTRTPTNVRLTDTGANQRKALKLRPGGDEVLSKSTVRLLVE